MTMVSDRLTDEQLAEILSGSVDGVEPTTQELAMATELQELRKQNELQRGELLKAHITLLNQQKQLQKYRNADSTEPVAMRWRWKDAELRNTGEWWYHDARYFAELSVDDSRECELMYSSPQSISGYPETLPCPVHLVPGLRFGKGCKTEGLLIALQRRAEYYAGLDAMTPEERAKHYANIEAFKAMLPQPAPVTPEDLRRSFEAVARLNNEMYRWTSCLSYNGSHVGEPEGLLKRNIREIERIMDTCRATILEGGINR